MGIKTVERKQVDENGIYLCMCVVEKKKTRAVNQNFRFTYNFSTAATGSNMPRVKEEKKRSDKRNENVGPKMRKRRRSKAVKSITSANKKGNNRSNREESRLSKINISDLCLSS